MTSRPSDPLDPLVPPPPGAAPSSRDNVIPLRTRGQEAVVEPSDAELLARCRRRDAEAWNLLVGRYERLVYSVARRNGLSAEDAADVTQGTFVTLIDSLGRIRDEERLASWLMTVTRRQAWRVRNLSRRDVQLDVAPEEVDESLEDWATVLTLHDALAELGGTCRSLLEALYFDPEEPSYAEIAERFGRSIGGIGPLRGRCLEKLRAILTEDGAW
ncbi:RNA polymerase sigma factor [Nocardioides humi]|uniref:Sigma-70 family RNA polymerase sigma factor n=1 Tax=Nocardioides humi TaxID=449461 RepID=A0ABN2ATN9_9ACTN|nr:sigma-70 family RNA polymerase sigma factor [Nocardioides humi]